MSPKITIAVQSYKNIEMLRLCLSAVEKNTRHSDVEVIVADAATSYETEVFMREEFPNFHFLSHKENVGFVALVNACLKESKGEYIFILNPDTVLEEKTVPQLEAYMDANTDIAMCGPAQKNFHGKREITRFNFYHPLTILYRRTFLKKLPFAKKHLSRFMLMDKVGVSEPYAAPWIMGSAMFVRRSDYEKIGPMDRRFFMYMEDVDWCRRFWERGLRVYYHPTIELFHYYGKGSAKKTFPGGAFFNKLTWIHISSAIKYFTKYAFVATPKMPQDSKNI